MNYQLIANSGTNFVELTIKNGNFKKQKNWDIFYLFTSCCSYCIFFMLFGQKLVFVHLLITLVVILSFLNMLKTCEKETITLIRDVGVEKSTFFSFGR